MLVLSRRESERIRLGDDIVVTVVRVSGDKVRLGIQAPPHVLVLREELEPHEQAATGPGRRAADGAASLADVRPASVEIELPLASDRLTHESFSGDSPANETQPDESYIAGCA